MTLEKYCIAVVVFGLYGLAVGLLHYLLFRKRFVSGYHRMFASWKETSEIVKEHGPFYKFYDVIIFWGLTTTYLKVIFIFGYSWYGVIKCLL